MIHWKNKPIDQLSKQELKTALFELAQVSVLNKKMVYESNTITPFAMGALSGALVAFLGMITAALI